MLEILKAIKKNRLISRPEIAQQTRLTSVTVNTLICELMKNRIVTEEGFANSVGGRKAVVYRFNASAYYIIGVSMQIKAVTIDLFDLDATKVMKGRTVHLEEGESVENIISDIIQSIQELIHNSQGQFHDIIGIGVTVPGRVDYENGVISHLTNLKGWVNIPLRDIIEREVNIPTFIERDSNSHISYLKWIDVTENRSNVVYCGIGEGIGAAVLINNSVYHGDTGLAGEVGHTTLELDGPPCNCGNFGCVEALASNKAILNYYKDLVDAQRRSAVDDLLQKEHDENACIPMLTQLALNGDEAADAAFSKAAKYLCACIGNIINTYNPSLIILECKWMKEARKYFNDITSKVFERNSLLDRNDVKIILNPVEDIFSRASSTIVLEHLFSDVDNNRLIG
jgi:predicted NBD/HSP70 family sugar kinase